MSVRTLGGFTHTEPESTIQDGDFIWFDSDRSASPLKATFATLKASSAQVHTAPQYSPVMVAGLPQSLTGAGAITLTEHSSNVTSNGAAQALTLADGTTVETTSEAGATQWSDSEEHLPENLSDEILEVVLVELKE